MTSRVLVAVLLAGCVLAASAKQGSFVDYLSTKKAVKTSGAKPTYSDYQPAELLEACLKPIGVDSCHSFLPTADSDTSIWDPQAFPYLVNYEMGCCHAKKSYNKELNTYLAKPTPVGNCKITYHPYTSLLALIKGRKKNDQATYDWVAEHVKEVGRFDLQCSLNDESSECGHPFCEKMVLSATGDVFLVEEAIISSTPPRLEPAETCIVEKPTTLPGLKSVQQSSKVKKADYYEESDKYYEEDGYSYSYLKKVGWAAVISGPVTVNSRLHGLKEIEDAWLEAVVDYDTVSEIKPATEEEAHKAYVLDPYTFKFSFIKSKSY